MYFRRRNYSSSQQKTLAKQPCARCMIIRYYLVAVFVLVLIGVASNDRAQFLDIVNKYNAAYAVLVVGSLITIYRFLEWLFVYKNK